ncbi:MAG: hypothetical protein ACKVE4_05695 [Dissulfuribacterales bacterium]
MYLFFIRAFNDVDHLTPIVWKMSRDNYPVVVYCINPEYDIENDYRIDFLRGLGVKVDSIYNNFDRHLGILHRVMRSFFQRAYAIQKRFKPDPQSPFSIMSNNFRVLARTAGVQLYKLTRRKFYSLDWARNILEETGARVLCFDWVRPERYVVDVLLKAAKEKSIPALALPHGVYLYTNDLVKSDLTEDRVREKYNCYDYVVVQNSLFKKVMLKSGVEGKKVTVLGSTRYCDEWMQQYKKILPGVMEPGDENSGKLKVVFMTTRSRYRVRVDQTIKTFDLLSKFEGIEVLVKPHTRTGKDVGMYKNLPLANVSDVSSVELCEWADVMLVVGSSIIIEALKQNKPVLYLKYHHENTMEYEEFGACWTIHDDTELQDALLSLKKTKKVPYTDKNVDRWLSEVIHGGQGKRDVLKDYEEFIVTYAGQA